MWTGNVDGMCVHACAGTQVCRYRQRAMLKLGDEIPEFIHPNKLGVGPWARKAKADSVPALEEKFMPSGERGTDNHSTDVKG